MEHSAVAAPAAVAGEITVTVLYFARLREALGRGSERIALPAAAASISALRERLQARGGAWAVELAAARPVRVAVNQEMVAGDVQLTNGDEVAFFPPVTGG
jgi:molybdopterin synthase sulfur carrier subunit